MRKIDFLYIGVDKAGSSWLYELLKNNEQVYVPEIKDLYYFDRFYKNGESWYHSFFKGVPSNVILGEISHDYFFSDDALLRIKNYNKDIKLIIFLRSHFDKIESSYQYLKRNGQTKKSIEDGLRDWPILIDKAKYSAQLETVYRHFPERQVLLCLYDELQENPADLARRICRYLEVEFMRKYDYVKVVRHAASPRSYLVSKIIKWHANVFRTMNLTWLVSTLKNSNLVMTLLYKKVQRSDIERLSVAYKEALLLGPLNRDMHELHKYTSRDISHWYDTK